MRAGQLERAHLELTSPAPVFQYWSLGHFCLLSRPRPAHEKGGEGAGLCSKCPQSSRVSRPQNECAYWLGFLTPLDFG